MVKVNAKRKKGLLRFAIATVTAAFLMIGQAAVSCAADWVPDLDKDADCTLTIQMSATDDAGITELISGAGMEVFRVADLETKGGGAYYTLTAQFAKSGISFKGMNTEDSNKAAGTFSETADKKGVEGMIKETDESGIVVYSDLEPGIYMVREISQNGTADKYMKIKPFLVTVPEIVSDSGENQWNYNVLAVPKNAPKFGPGTVVVDPPVKKIVNGNPSVDGTFSFKLKAEEPTYPMPQGSTNGEKIMNVTGPGEYEFGEWEITEPGVYKYFITELNNGESGYTYDTTEYSITYDVTYDDGKLKVNEVIIDNQGKDADEIVFTNNYEPPQIIKTGDSMMIAPLIGLMAFALAGMCLAVRKRKTN